LRLSNRTTEKINEEVFKIKNQPEVQVGFSCHWGQTIQ